MESICIGVEQGALDHHSFEQLERAQLEKCGMQWTNGFIPGLFPDVIAKQVDGGDIEQREGPTSSHEMPASAWQAYCWVAEPPM